MYDVWWFGGYGYGYCYDVVVCLWDKVRFERGNDRRIAGFISTFSMGADINCFNCSLNWV